MSFKNSETVTFLRNCPIFPKSETSPLTKESEEAISQIQGHKEWISTGKYPTRKWRLRFTAFDERRTLTICLKESDNDWCLSNALTKILTTLPNELIGGQGPFAPGNRFPLPEFFINYALRSLLKKFRFRFHISISFSISFSTLYFNDRFVSAG